MRVKCHGCQAVWEMDDAQATSRCAECRILAVPPRVKSLIGVPVTSDPPDAVILGLRPEAVRGSLRQAWAAFLTAIPPDRFPLAFRQGREAYERLGATLETTRSVSRWIIEHRCVGCGDAERFGFAKCLVCRRAIPNRDERAVAERPRITSQSKTASSALREVEARWRVGKFAELLAAAERGLADTAIEEQARARLQLLYGHALASNGQYDEAGERWLAALIDKGESAEASTCLASTAYAKGEVEEALHYLGTDDERSSGRGLLAAALHAARRHREAIVSASALAGDPAHDVALRARWIAAASELESGNPRGASRRLHEVLERLAGESRPSLAEHPPLASMPADLAWLAGVTVAALGAEQPAIAWLKRGAELAPDDPAFPRDLANLALQHGRFDEAEAYLEATRQHGDTKGAARGRALVEFFRGSKDPSALVDQAAKLDDAHLYYFAGRVFERRGNTHEAVRSYSRAAQTDPLMTSAWSAAGILYARLGERTRAMQALNQAFERGERSTPLLQSMTTLMLEDGRLDEAEPLLAELYEREPDDATIRGNLAGVRCLLGLEQANEGNEEEAIEGIQGALALDPSNRTAWNPVLAELAYRAAERVIARRADGWSETALDLLDRSRERGGTSARDGLARATVHLARAAEEASEARSTEAKAAEQALAAARAGLTDPNLCARIDLHRAIALHLAGDSAGADQILRPWLKIEIDPVTRLRIRWVLALSIAKQGNPLAGRVLLEASLEECAKIPEIAEFIKRVRLQTLKLRAAELGAHRIENEIRALEPAKRTPAMMLLYGIVLAGQQRFDEAASALDTAAKDPAIRSEAQTTRFLMQMSRIAELLAAQKEGEALKLFTRLRPTLPTDTEIDLWLNSLEVEGLPVAALRRGDGKPAVATWTSKVQAWRKARNDEYSELIRSIAIAAHRTAVRAEKARDYGEAQTYWKIAVARWLELLGTEEWWAGYARRARDLFPSSAPELLDEVRSDLVDVHVLGLLREVIGHLRQAGDHLAAADRFGLIEQIETWRLERDPGNPEIRRSLAGCHAQRLIIYADQQMWDEARRWGEKACEADPADPVHFNNMAETYGAQARVELARLEAQYATHGPGPHLQPLAWSVIDFLALALAWNPYHPHILQLYSDVSSKVGYGGPPESDPRMRRGAELRANMAVDALERFAAAMAAGGELPEEEPSAPEAAPSPQPRTVDAGVISELTRRLKAAGLDAEAAYIAVITTFPVVASRPQAQVMSLINAA